MTDPGGNACRESETRGSIVRIAIAAGGSLLHIVTAALRGDHDAIFEHGRAFLQAARAIKTLLVDLKAEIDK